MFLENRDDFCILKSDKQVITIKTTPMLSNDKITEIYFIIDEFNKEFDKTMSAHSLNEKDATKKRNRKFTITEYPPEQVHL